MKWSALAALMALEAVLLCAGISVASRNSSGTYSLFTPGNPIVTGTLSNATIMNNTLSDIATSLTDSLDRNGKGGMLAALRGADGTVAAPAFSWTSETGSGLFRNGTSDVRMSISGTSKTFWSATGLGVGVAPTKTLQVLLTGSSGATASSNTSAMFESSGQNDVSLLSANAQGEAIVFGDVASGTRGSIAYFNSTNAAADQMQFSTNSTKRATISNSGLSIGASGTAISQSGRGTASLTPAAINSQQCQTQSVTVSGATAGTECLAGMPSGGLGSLSLTCNVTSTTACTLYICNPTTGSVTPPTGTYTCRYFNP